MRGGNLRDERLRRPTSCATTAHSYLLFFSNRGRVYRLRAHEIPMKERTARGVALVNLISLGPDEQIQAVIDTRTYEDGAYLFFATKNGIVKKTKMSEYDSSIRSGLMAINLRGNDELVRVIQTTGNDDIFMVSRKGMTIRFAESAVRADGPRRRRGARHEAAQRGRRRRGGRRRPTRRGDALRRARAGTGSARSSTCSRRRVGAARAYGA